MASPTTTLSRDAVPSGDDIEQVGESRVDVETRNEEGESLEEGIPSFDVIQKNLTSREELEPEDCGHADCRSWCVVCVQGNFFKLKRWRKKEEKGQTHHGYLLTASSCYRRVQMQH